jgi:hypothetical protein
MAITTSMADSFKTELLQGGHCFQSQVTTTGTGTSGTGLVTVGSIAGIAVGMNVNGTGLNASAYVATITSATVIAVGPQNSATVSGTITLTGDVFKIALVKATPTGTYNNTTSNYSQVTGNTDEVTNSAGTAYTAGGVALGNVSATLSGAGGQAFVTFSPPPSWTTASFSTSGCMIYNSSNKIANITGRACGVFDFGGQQTVTSGTFTVVMPAASSGTAILRIA